jgi:hypothetical protein
MLNVDMPIVVAPHCVHGQTDAGGFAVATKTAYLMVENSAQKMLIGRLLTLAYALLFRTGIDFSYFK